MNSAYTYSNHHTENSARRYFESKSNFQGTTSQSLAPSSFFGLSWYPYYYLAEERGRHLSGHDDCSPARRLVRLGDHEPASIFFSTSRLAAVSQPQSFYFGTEKTEEEKVQTPLWPTTSSCLHSSTAHRKEISGFPPQISPPSEIPSWSIAH